jgi:hypothetical protein
MLFEALTGRLPFEGRAIEVLMRKQREDAPPVRAYCDVPDDLAKLCTELLSIEPWRRPTAAAIMARLTRSASPVSQQPPPFLGRATELATLEAALDEVAAGATRTIFVEGEAGIGKSALVQSFATRAESRSEVRVVAGRCNERETTPFKGIDGVVDALVRDLVRRNPVDVALLLTPEVEALARVFPVLRRVPAISRLSVRKPDSPIELRARAFRGLRQLLGALAARNTLVVVIDDVQWADTDTLALLREILHAPGAPWMLLVLTRRNDNGPPPALSGPTTTITLDRLDDDAGRGLLAALAPDRQRDAEQLLVEAGGHPRFLQELVRHSVGAVSRLDDALWTRVTHLDHTARKLLELVAVAGAPVPQSAIGLALGVDRPGLSRAIDALRATWLVRIGGTRGRDPIEPYHDRIREAVLARIPARRRRRHHERLAAVLANSEVVDKDPLIVVRHLEAAGACERAADLAERAARKASDALAFELAAELWKAVLRNGAHDDDARRRILVSRAEALGYAGHGHAAAQAYLAAAIGADPETSAHCRRLAAHELLVSGHIPEGQRLLDEIFTSIGEYFPRDARAARRFLAWQWFRTLLRGTRFTPRVTPDARALDRLRLDLFRTVSLALGTVDLVPGAAFQARGLLIALRLGDPRRITHALAYHAMYLASSGIRVPWARRLVSRAQELAAGLGSPFLIGWARAAEGMVEFFGGNYVRATEILTDAESQMRERSVGTAAELNHVRVFITFALRRHGDFNALHERQREYLVDAQRRGDRYAAASFQWASNVGWLARDEVEQARDELAPDAWSPPEQGLHLQHWFRVRGLLELALYEDDRAAMPVLGEQIKEFLGPSFSHVEAVRTETRYLLGRIAIVAGDARAARRAVAPLRRNRAPYVRAFVRLVRAAADQLEGKLASAHAELTAAVADAESVEMMSLAALARLRLGETELATLILRQRGVANVESFARIFATWPDPIRR